ncbi:interferon-induced protein with tetratricopeptide repeats 5-like [Denticeps clupeoides]|uniref:interferon-induced protein with tetratricopeptide repeats 5-like n=1 Tax=Denticeps clupeoides TaxID=299321 RepID=UPI0010A395F3|nr:interferon-induced protein with tetratricopeptide repeats 5-like [Denticeps clupeoides]
MDGNNESQMKELECLFTWGVEKSDMKDLDTLLKNHLHRGDDEAALDYLHKAEDALKKDKRDEADFVEDKEFYLNQVKSISEDTRPAVHGEKGWSLMKMGPKYYEKSKESFEKALEIKPEHLSYNMGYGVVLYRMEDLDKEHEIQPEDSAAVKQLRKTLALYPDFTEAMTLLAVKKTQESCELVLKALSLSPNEKHIKKYLVHYIKKCSPEESLEMIKSALVQTPTSNYYEVGVCYKEKYVQLIKSGRRDEAAAYVKKCIRFLSEAVRLDPSNTNAMMNLAEAYAEDQQLQRAEEIFTNLIQEGQLGEKDKQHCHFIYGRFLYFKRNDEDRSVEQYKEAYKIQVYSGDRKKAGERLRQVATRKHGQMSNEIWAFLAAEDEKSNKGDDLASEFSQKVNL